MDNIIRVGVIAGFEPLRMGLVETLGGAPDIEIVGETTSLGELIANPSVRDADVFVVDVDTLGRGTAQGTVAQLNEWLPALRVLFLGNQEDARVISPDDLPVYMSLNTVGFIFRNGPTARHTADIGEEAAPGWGDILRHRSHLGLARHA